MRMAYLKTKYGLIIPDHILIQYFERLIGRIYKILPLKEENIGTLTIYVQYLTIELNSGKKLMIEDVGFYELLINLESLFDISTDHQTYKSHVFQCIKICQSIIDKIQKGAEEDGV